MTSPRIDDGRDIHGPHAMKFGWGTKLIMAVLLGLALVGAIGQVLSAIDSRARDRTSLAQARLSRCQSTVNANWRKATSVVLVGAGIPKGGELGALEARRLHLPTDREAVLRIGFDRVVAALQDDARITSHDHPICPFAPGDPEATPDRPVDSATDALEHRLGS